MVLPSSGYISLSNIQTEFGGTAPIYFSEYYTNAVSGYTTGVSGLPVTGNQMFLSQFHGKAKPVVVSGTTFSRTFTQSAVSTACTDWVTFCQGLTGTYTSIKLSGSFDATGRTTTNSTIVNGVITALRNGTDYSAYDSATTYTWAVGTCGQARTLSATGAVCSCGIGFVFRPCIGNANWGGVNTETCNGPTQTMTVTVS
jgi:hypothetical protein